MTPITEISKRMIDTAMRYKNGDISKSMYRKYLECDENAIIYNMIGCKDITTMMIYIAGIIQLRNILHTPNIPEGYKTGGTIVGENEEIVCKDGRIFSINRQKLSNAIIKTDK